jgi:hypothetical protein
MPAFKRTIVVPDVFKNLDALLEDYEIMLATIMRTLLERHERDANYPFVEMKLNIISGQDFTEPADSSRDFKSRSAIFGWIQGRGLESIVTHARWMPECSPLPQAERAALAARLRKAAERILNRMEQIRARSGRIPFMMTPDGQAFGVDADGRRSKLELKTGVIATGDLFYAKGMFAAASFLKLEDKTREAKEYLRKIFRAISENAFSSDQISFDPKNKVAPTPGKFSHGSRMLSLGAIGLVAAESKEDEWLQTGEEFIRHVNARYVNHGRNAALAKYDFYEHTDASGNPWTENGKILSDPGHALEYIGFASKVLLLMRERKPNASQTRLIEECGSLFPELLLQNFNNGFNPSVGGICKSFDLLSRKPANSDMPWWNLPETLRAAAELLVLFPQTPRRKEIMGVIASCSNGFMRSFVNPSVSLMAYQTVSAEGKPVDVIPATPDADPGYHTGLSIIDFLACMRKARTT